MMITVINTPTGGTDLQNMQVWVATTPVDMRKSFDGLAEVVRSFLGRDPLSGNLFVFRNKGGHLAKVLWWDCDGLAIYYKRLEQGEFQFPRTGKPVIEISCEQLLRLLSGARCEAPARVMFCKISLHVLHHALQRFA